MCSALPDSLQEIDKMAKPSLRPVEEHKEKVSFCAIQDSS